MKKVILLMIGIAFLVSCKSNTEQTNAPDDPSKIRLYKGMFSYVAETQEVYFTECNRSSAISMAVLKDLDFAELFSAYEKVQTDNPVDFVYVEFNGYIYPKKDGSESGNRETIAVTEFKTLKKKKKCN